MFFNLDIFIFILAIIVFGGLFAYTIYIILPINFIQFFSSPELSFFEKMYFFILIRLVNFGITAPQNSETSVSLSDADLNDLLEVLWQEIGNSTEISAALLKSLGLYTPTVVSYLIELGYTIF